MGMELVLDLFTTVIRDLLRAVAPHGAVVSLSEISHPRHGGRRSQFQEDGAPGEIRTPDLLVRSQTLYPTELRAR
jgi:hypothetical protein